METWSSTGELPLSEENLQALLDNKIAAIRIRNFASDGENSKFTIEAKKRIKNYYSISQKVGYIGIAQVEYRWREDRGAYFDAVEAAEREIQDLFDATFNPRKRLIEMLRDVTGSDVDIAEDSGRKYYAGIVRSTVEGIGLHADWAPGNSKDYSIGGIDGQLGWNYFAETVNSGGETIVYNRPWSPPSDVKSRAESYGLDQRLVENTVPFIYRGEPGDVVLFNSRNPHEIKGGEAEAGQSRVSIGSFIGRMPGGKLILWS